jgi:DNA repair photolyase
MGQEVIKERHGVRYFDLKTRSLLNRCTSPNVPFAWTANPYRGCAMGCRYCYATYSHEYLGIARADDFHRVVYVKRDSPDETSRRLARAVRSGGLVAVGTVTDPYQPGEVHLRSTRAFLETAAAHRSLRLSITTKGALILRDLEILKAIDSRSRLSIMISLISTDAGLLKRLEPWAPPPEVRLRTLETLVGAGLKVTLGVMPIVPGLTDGPRSLDALFRSAAACGVRRYARGLLFLRSPTREKFFAWLGAEEPRLLRAYEQEYGRRSRLSGRYEDGVLALADRLAARHGLERRTLPEREKGAVQLTLF